MRRVGQQDKMTKPPSPAAAAAADAAQLHLHDASPCICSIFRILLLNLVKVSPLPFMGRYLSSDVCLEVNVED